MIFETIRACWPPQDAEANSVPGDETLTWNTVCLSQWFLLEVLLSYTVKSSFFYYLCPNSIQLITSLNIWALLYAEAASIREDDRRASKPFFNWVKYSTGLVLLYP